MNNFGDGTADAPDGTSGEIQLSPEAEQAIDSLEQCLAMLDKFEAAGLEAFGQEQK
jgi:hypothetical protein